MNFLTKFFKFFSKNKAIDNDLKQDNNKIFEEVENKINTKTNYDKDEEIELFEKQDNNNEVKIKEDKNIDIDIEV